MSKIIDLVPKDTARIENVVECLEAWLAMAKAGEITAIAIAGMRADGGSTVGFTQDAASAVIIGGLEVVKADLLEMFGSIPR